MTTATAFSESDVTKLRTNIAALERRHQDERAAADKKVADVRASGVDPLDGTSNGKAAFEEIDELYKVADATNQEIQEAKGTLERVQRLVVGSPEHDDPRQIVPAAGPAGGRVDVAGRLWTSQEFTRLRESGLLEAGADGSNAAFAIAPVEVANRAETLASFGRPQAATIDADPLVPSDRRLMPPIDIPTRPRSIIDLIQVLSTDSDSVEYSEQTTRTNAAASAAFGTALPESAYEWAVRTVNVRRKGHHVTATRGNLADQGQLQGILETLLEDDLRVHLEDEMVDGAGTGELFEGILTATGIGSVTYQDASHSSENRFDAIHRAITVVRLADRRDPTGVGYHPNDHEEQVLSKTSTGAYIAANPTESDRRTVWGFPAVPSDAFNEGTAVVANWRRAATLWVRTGTSVEAYNQHSDYALKGLVLLTAWLRAAFKTVRPDAVCEVTSL